MLEYLIGVHIIFTVISILLALKYSKGHYTDYRFFILILLAFVPVLNIIATMNTISEE